MNHWWVNHSQTFKSEFEGGYIWSPKTNANGSFNQSYQNLTLTNVGDRLFSYSDTKIKAIGIIKSKCESANNPAAFAGTDRYGL